MKITLSKYIYAVQCPLCLGQVVHRPTRLRRHNQNFNVAIRKSNYGIRILIVMQKTCEPLKPHALKMCAG